MSQEKHKLSKRENIFVGIGDQAIQEQEQQQEQVIDRTKINNKRSCVEHRPDLKTPSEDYQEQEQQQEQVFGEQDYQDQEKNNKSKSSVSKTTKTKKRPTRARRQPRYPDCGARHKLSRRQPQYPVRGTRQINAKTKTES